MGKKDEKIGQRLNLFQGIQGFVFTLNEFKNKLKKNNISYEPFA